MVGASVVVFPRTSEGTQHMVRVLHKGGRVAKEASNRCFSHCTYLRSHAPPSEQLQQICMIVPGSVQAFPTRQLLLSQPLHVAVSRYRLVQFTDNPGFADKRHMSLVGRVRGFVLLLFCLG